MTISKAHWDTDGDSVRLSLPFAKVDKERRIVSGFASLDNLDKQGDIVTSEASLKAFSKFRGNIREMHQPLAVGKMVNFKEDRYFDPESKKFYSGVFVSAYVSKGAQDTWEKVLDGTLTGFSIGGRMNKWDDGYDEKSDTTIRIIKDYDLVELSLVDSPANQFANIMHVGKVDGVEVVKGQDVELSLFFFGLAELYNLYSLMHHIEKEQRMLCCDGTFGVISKRRVKDLICIPICIGVPIMFFVLNTFYSQEVFGDFQFGSVMLGMNAAIVYIFLWIFSKRPQTLSDF